MTLMLLQIMVNALSIAAAVKLVDGITFTGEWWKMIVIGALFGVVNTLIKPVVKLITFPLILLTLGLFTLIVNTLMLALTEWLSKPLALGLEIQGFWPTFWGALIVSIMSVLLSWATGMRKMQE
jgi:putative membrane protein